MAIYVVERTITRGNVVVLGKLGPELSVLEKLAESRFASVTLDLNLADYKGRVRQNIPNPRYGSKSIHYMDPEFGPFGVRFYDEYNSLTIWTLASILVNSPVSKQAIQVRSSIPDEHEVLHKEEINKPPVGMIFRYHPSANMTGRRIIMDHILPR